MAFHRASGDPYDHLADINVTPLVDVMLVLLIIFMVTAPMLHQGVSVSLPKTETTNLPSSVEDPIILSITRDGLYYIGLAPTAGRVSGTILGRLAAVHDLVRIDRSVSPARGRARDSRPTSASACQR